MGSIHERVSLTVSLTAWWVVLGVFLITVPLYMIFFAAAQARRNPAGAGFIVLGALLFLAIPVFEHFEFAFQRMPERSAEDVIYLRAAEELAEMAGMLAFLAGGMHFALRASGQTGPEAVFRFSGRRKGFAAALAALAVLAAGGTALAAGLNLAKGGSGADGHPANWFMSAPLFLMAVLLAAHAGRGGGRAGVLALALSSVLGSAFHGADLQRFLWAGIGPEMRLAGALVLGMPPALLLAAGGLHPLPRLLGIAAAAVLAASVWTAAPGVYEPALAAVAVLAATVFYCLRFAPITEEFRRRSPRPAGLGNSPAE